MNEPVHFLGAADIRRLASEHGIRPTKAWGQNFVIDANTVRRIVRLAEVTPEDVVLEVGPGLGSLTLGLLESAGRVLVIEIDPVLAAALPATVAGAAGDRSARLGVIPGDALKVTALPAAPTKSRTYGAPSAKAAWFGTVRLAGTVGRTIFWPVPKVDSGLVAIERGQPPRTDIGRREVFAVVDAAFAQRRKMLRSALAGWAGSPAAASSILTAAGVDPTTRGEHLGIAAFADIAAARCAYADPEPPRPRPGPGDF